MECFDILGIMPTEDVKSIKRAYAHKTKEFHPEDHPDEFRKIYQAYEEALKYAEYQKVRVAVQEQGGMDETESGFERERISVEPITETETFESTAYEQIAGAAAKNGKQMQIIREIMNQCRQYYLDERERNRLYHWKDIFEDVDWQEVFSTREFVQVWYEFLKSHHLFSQQIWWYFASLEGKLFDGGDYEFGRFSYEKYLEEEEFEKRVQQKEADYLKYLKLQGRLDEERKPFPQVLKNILWLILSLLSMIQMLLED